MKKLIPFVFVLLVAAGCSQFSNEPQVIKIENRYSLTLPSFLSKSTILHEEASLQYANLFKEFYVIVIDEAKDELFDAIEQNGLPYDKSASGYTEMYFDSMEEEFAGGNISATESTKINGMEATITTIDSKVENINVFYTLGVIEGKERFYQVLVWCLDKDKEKNKNKMLGIIKSLQELY